MIIEHFLNSLVQFYSNNETNLHHLTSHSTPHCPQNIEIVTWPQIIPWCHVIMVSYVFFCVSSLVVSAVYCHIIRVFSVLCMFTARSELRKFLFFWRHLRLFGVWNISGTGERICAKFTRKTCLLPRSDEFEYQGQRSRLSRTKTAFSALSAACVHAVYVW